MNIDPTILKRLSFIKSLFQLGVKQSKQKPPLDSISILMLHDSVELFLHLSTEVLNSNRKTNIGFLEYWEVINRNLTGQQLSQKNQMNRLNKARVNLKHHGILLNKSDIESFRINVTDFYNDNFPLIFGIDFGEISIIDLIDNLDVRDILKNAIILFQQKNFDRSYEHLSLAFRILILDFESDFKPHRYELFGIEYFSPSCDLEEIRPDLEELSSRIDNINSIMKYLIYGIDVKNYIKFSLLTPDVYFKRGNYKNYEIYAPLPVSGKNKKNISQNQFDFCIDFIIDSALKLQEFDFDTLNSI